MSKGTFKAWQIECQWLGGSERERKVYLHQRVAQLIAASEYEELIDYVLIEVAVVPISKTEGAIGHELVAVDGMTETEYHRAVGLKKLTIEEREALGLA